MSDNITPAEPERIEIQHVLISFAGTGTRARRSQADAAELAATTLARANAGEDFDALVRELTDDSPPGIYRLSNNGVSPASGEYPRGRMVAAFGNDGWHIIKRLA